MVCISAQKSSTVLTLLICFWFSPQGLLLSFLKNHIVHVCSRGCLITFSGSGGCLLIVESVLSVWILSTVSKFHYSFQRYTSMPYLYCSWVHVCVVPFPQFGKVSGLLNVFWGMDECFRSLAWCRDFKCYFLTTLDKRRLKRNWSDTIILNVILDIGFYCSKLKLYFSPFWNPLVLIFIFLWEQRTFTSVYKQQNQSSDWIKP